MHIVPLVAGHIKHKGRSKRVKALQITDVSTLTREKAAHAYIIPNNICNMYK
jgi:hypothetical protein